MTENEYPRLCGGTFFTLLLQARKQRIKAREHRKGERDGLSETDMLVGLIKVMNPDYEEPTATTEKTFKTNTSDYKSCKISKGTYLPFDECDAFDNRVKNDYNAALKAMCGFIEQFIETGTSGGKDKRLIKALIELISEDLSITNEQIFYSCSNGMSIGYDDLISADEVCLQPFLLGIWHFVLTNKKDNTIGQTTYDRWCPSKGGGERTYEGKMGSNVSREISVTIYSLEESEDTDDKAYEYVRDVDVIEGEPYTDEKNADYHDGASQTINTSAVFINHGANATQINNHGTVNISGGKVKNE